MLLRPVHALHAARSVDAYSSPGTVLGLPSQACVFGQEVQGDRCAHKQARWAFRRTAVGVPEPCNLAPILKKSACMQADWRIVERGWHAHVLGEAEHKFKSALEGVKKLRVPFLFQADRLTPG